MVTAYLSIDHRHSSSLQWLCYPVFGLLVALQTWYVVNDRARNPPAAFGIRMLSCRVMQWFSMIMVSNDSQTGFKRIQGSSDNGAE